MNPHSGRLPATVLDPSPGRSVRDSQRLANAGVINAAGDATPDAWQRFVAYMLRSYANPGAPLPPMPDAPAPIALYRAMVRLNRPGTARGSEDR